MRASQAASSVLMVRPAAFGFNPDTVSTNVFQIREAPPAGEVAAQARREFDALVCELQRASVDAIIVDDTEEPRTPDAVFPNNWISFHEDGTVVLYPMLSPLRRLERRHDILVAIERRGFFIRRLLDLTLHEKESCYLEGTGAVVFDYVNRMAYAGVSSRMHPAVLRILCRELQTEPVTFRATSTGGAEIYHTNVMLAIGSAWAVVAGEAIDDDGQRQAVFQALEDSGHEIISITREQMAGFCGNILEVQNAHGHAVIVMSCQAHRRFTARQVDRLSRFGTIVASPLDCIERIEGGSARCMLAAVHLPRKDHQAGMSIPL